MSRTKSFTISIAITGLILAVIAILADNSSYTIKTTVITLPTYTEQPVRSYGTYTSDHIGVFVAPVTEPTY